MDYLYSVRQPHLAAAELIWQHGTQPEVPVEVILNGKADAWRQRIESQRASGQSVRAWCKANAAQEGSFYWWRSRLGLSPLDAKPSTKKRRASNAREAKPTPLAFAKVVVHPFSTESLRLRLVGERDLIFPASMPLEQVAKLVHAIESTT